MAIASERGKSIFADSTQQQQGLCNIPLNNNKNNSSKTIACIKCLHCVRHGSTFSWQKSLTDSSQYAYMMYFYKKLYCGIIDIQYTAHALRVQFNKFDIGIYP